MKLSIIIVNWQTKNFLEKCLKSIQSYGKNYSENIDFETIVIDNNSNDESRKFLSEFKIQNSKFKIILNHKNLGFARAVNRGIKLSKGEYILLLNPDTEIKENTFKILEFMESHLKIGVCGGKILNSDGTLQNSVRKFPNLVSQIFVLLKIHHFFRNFKPIRNYFALDFDYSKTQEVDQVMGSFFMVRKKLIEEIGFFDEKFFLWFEEVDFCRRAKKAGWQIYYYPEAEIIHQKATSFSQVSPFKNQWQFNQSLLYYFKKHHSFFSWFILLLLQPISLLLSLIVSFLPGIKKLKKL
ncbi:MAG: glycosyltransferase family 2 protein [Patescibacteria group bacterium]|nr:glycosyltransferase family 2 protein [Patescibacteria group bacterium]